MSGTIKLLDEQTFTEEIQHGVTLVDFFAEWCGPCKMLAPIMEQLAKEVPDNVKICKLDIDKAEKTAASYNIMSVPTIMVFCNGEMKEKKIGLTSKSVLLDMIENAACVNQ